MLDQLDARLIIQLHERALVRAADPGDGDEAGAGNAFWAAVERNHRYNRLLWEQEDQARRHDVPAQAIAENKRAIDRYNQGRNDAVEEIDAHLLRSLATVQADPSSRLSSETAGAMIDRLSILSLKIFHMKKQTERRDVSEAHTAQCGDRLRRLQEQRCDLQFCLDRLLQEARQGRAHFKVYRQYKMYNDPALNPYLYGAKN